MTTVDSLWRHLESRPHLWRKQWWVKGTRVQAAKLALRVAKGEPAELLAAELNVPVAAVAEAVRYSVSNRELIENELAEDVRLEEAAKSGGLHAKCEAAMLDDVFDIEVYRTYLVLGLGNPAERYMHTRHNIGWDVVDALSAKYDIQLSQSSDLVRWGVGSISNRTVILAHALTFMNDSGQAAHELVHTYDLVPPQVLVVYDDMALPLGSLRLRPSGSAGGHNGLKSLQSYIGDTYPRLRLGIAPSEAARASDLYEFVLSPFAQDEIEIVKSVTALAVEGVACTLERGVLKAMATVSRKVPLVSTV